MTYKKKEGSAVFVFFFIGLRVRAFFRVALVVEFRSYGLGVPKHNYKCVKDEGRNRLERCDRKRSGRRKHICIYNIHLYIYIYIYIYICLYIYNMYI